MKKLVNTLMIFLTVAAVISLQSCQKDELGSVPDQEPNSLDLKSSTMNTFYSPAQPMGNGVARGWVMVNKMGEPLEVGINLSGKALMNLPDEPQMFVFELPKNKGQKFYTHLLVDWNPQGHEPEGVYTLPHFDFHFYIIPSSVRMDIPPSNDMDLTPAPEFQPPLYMQLPGLVPEMGAHWVDLLAPEFNGGIFSSTFIWGSYHGEFVFWEPMITVDYLNSHPDQTFDIRQPQAFQKSGWYPMNYQVTYSTKPDEFKIALTNLVYHDGTDD